MGPHAPEAEGTKRQGQMETKHVAEIAELRATCNPSDLRSSRGSGPSQVVASVCASKLLRHPVTSSDPQSQLYTPQEHERTMAHASKVDSTNIVHGVLPLLGRNFNSSSTRRFHAWFGPGCGKISRLGVRLRGSRGVLCPSLLTAFWKRCCYLSQRAFELG